MKRFLLTILLCATVLASFSQLAPTTAKMSLSADSVLIGDTVRLNIDIDKDVAQEISIAMFKDNRLTEQIEIIGNPILDTLSRDGRHIKLRLGYVLTSFDAGSYKLEKFPLLLGQKEPFDTIYAHGQVLMNVGTFEIDTLKDQPYDIAPVMDAPWQWDELWDWIGTNWVLIAGILAGLIVIGGAIWWWLRRKAHKEALASLPPHIKAILALEALHSKKMWQSGQVKEYFSVLTDILRLYIENRYGTAAMEMTTPEILAALKSENPEKIIAPIRELLSLTDLVKFAKLQPDAQQCETSYFDVYYYVEHTKQEVVENENEKNEKQ